MLHLQRSPRPTPSMHTSCGKLWCKISRMLTLGELPGRVSLPLSLPAKLSEASGQKWKAEAHGPGYQVLGIACRLGPLCDLTMRRTLVGDRDDMCGTRSTDIDAW
mmetsp:Transcript_16901/g.50722  ORF Transcript_16901/g.50722 Transcript_16901/m.50722 type:complete len:105 (+) Transcript_16901:601-915(+)